MAKKSNPKLIGGFVVGAIVLVIVGLLAFGGTQFLKPKGTFVMYFDSSLSGLAVGSPVTFRGVQVGTVSAIVIEYDIGKQELHIPVYIEIEADKFHVSNGAREPKRNMEALIKRGLRGQLQTVSLVTGQSSIDFDFYPDSPVRLVADDSGLQQLPSIPSDIDLLKANVTSVLAKISKLPLEKISDQIADVLTSTDRMIKDATSVVNNANGLIANVDSQVKPLSDSVQSTASQATSVLKEAQSRLELKDGEPMQNLNLLLADGRRLMDSLNRDLPPIINPTIQALAKTSAALDQISALVQSAQRLISPGSPIYYELNSTLTEFKSAARAIRVFAEYIQRNPNALLRGNAPK